MNGTDKEQLKAMLGQCLDDKLEPIRGELKGLDKSLNNHLKTYAEAYAKMSTDVEWIKRLMNGGGKGKDGMEDIIRSEAQQETNIGWLKWGFRFIITAIVVNAIGVIFIAYRILEM